MSAGRIPVTRESRALRRYFPNVLLRTQHGKSARFYDDLIQGRTVVLQLMYTLCSQYCSTITPNLVTLRQSLDPAARHQVSFLSLTVDPERDSPEALKSYAARYDIGPDWLFVTGRKDDTRVILRCLGLSDPEGQTTGHLALLTLGNEPLGQWFAMPALSATRELVKAVTRLLPAPAAAALR